MKIVFMYGGDNVGRERLPLTAGQRGIWVGQQLSPGSTAYGVAECIELRGPVDLPSLRAAIERTVAECDALHMVFGQEEGQPFQQPAERALNVAHVPLPEVAPEAQVERHALRDLSEPFDLSSGPLCRHTLLSNQERVFWYHAAHHVALDGFGFSLISQRVAQLYAALQAGRQPPPTRFGSLAQVLEDERAYRESQAYLADRAFWHARLAQAEAPISLSEQQAPASERAVCGSAQLDAQLRAQLDALGRAARGSWVDALLALVASFLAERCNRHELTLGLPMSGRLGAVSARVPCMVMNIVPLCLRIPPTCTPQAACAQVAAELRTLRPHARYRYEELRRELGLVGGGRRLFGPVVNILPFDHGAQFAGLPARVHRMAAGPVEDLAINVQPRGSELSLQLLANPALYGRGQVEELLEQLKRYMQDKLRQPEAPLRALPQSQLGALLTGEPLALPTLDVTQLLLHQAARHPAEAALEQAGEALNYQALVLRARRVAGLLRAAGVVEGSLVALLLPRSCDAIVSMHAVLMMGAAYLPLDPAGPQERTRAILRDASPALVLTSSALRERAQTLSELPVLLVEEAEQARPYRELTRFDPERSAYVIYTSGSTGQPNGVVISRGALAHFVAAACQRYAIPAGARVLQFAPLHFDASVEEIYLTVALAGTLVLRSDAMLDSMAAFVRAVGEQRVAVLDLPTAFWHELTFALSSGACAWPENAHTVIIGGEAAAMERVREFCAATAGKVRLINTYGPTEATVVATTQLLTGQESEQTFAPIGRPLPGLSAVVVDASGTPLPHGVAGELCLLGPCLAREYLARPQLTAQRFFSLPGLSSTPRAYRTGDKAMLQADGSLAFLGRLDRQLKISGQRVDLSEVESVLLRHPALREAAVTTEQEAGHTRLIAHVVRGQRAALDLVELRRHARAHLLAAAVPQRFLLHDALPRNRSGKVDRQALAALAAAQRESQPRDQVPLLSPLARRVLEVCRQHLGLPDLRADEDLFERGVQSLQTIQLATRLSLELERQVDAPLLFRYSSCLALADVLEPSGLAAHAGPAALELDALLPSALLPERARSQPQDGSLGHVLLTGATGFVGPHLLHALCAAGASSVVCLVRGSDDAHAKQRLQEALRAQGLSPVLPSGVRVLAADLASERLGLSTAVYQQLAEQADAIFHNGAVVSLTRAYASMRAANVLSVRELLRLAAQGRAKSLRYVSTLAVAMQVPGEAHAPEQFVPRHAGLRDGYTQSKWAAEHLLEQAHARGFDVQVVRLGRVVGPFASGFVNRDDILWRVLRAGLPRKVLPLLDVHEPWTPVDAVAQAVVALAKQRDGGPVYNLATAPQLELCALFGWLGALGYEFELVTVPQFCARLADAGDADTQATLAFFALQQREQAGHDGPSARPIEAQRARAALAASGVRVPTIDRSWIERYLSFAVQHGLLPPAMTARSLSTPGQLAGRDV